MSPWRSPRYRRLRKWNLLTFSIFVGNFCPTGSVRLDPDPQHCFLFIYLFQRACSAWWWAAGPCALPAPPLAGPGTCTTGTAESFVSECIFLGHVGCIVPDPGCLSQIRVFSIPNPGFHPGSASKNLSILTQKMVSEISEIRFGRDAHPGSWSRIRILIWGQKGTGFRIRICYTGRIIEWYST